MAPVSRFRLAVDGPLITILALVVVAVGGEGTGAILFSVVPVTFVIVMSKVVVQLLPTVAAKGTRVMRSAFQVQAPWLLRVSPVFFDELYVALTLLNKSFLSVSVVTVVLLMMLKVKFFEFEPTVVGIWLAVVLAVQVIFR